MLQNHRMKSFRERSVRKVSIFDTLGYNKWVFQILTGSWSTLFIISYICFTLSIDGIYFNYDFDNVIIIRDYKDS